MITYQPGILADGTGNAIWANMSQSRLLAIDNALNLTIQTIQDMFTAHNGGLVLGNGIVEYSGFIDHDMPSLGYMDGAMAEHFAVFEAVLSDGSLNATMVDNMMQLIVQASNRNKTVVVGTWPGPCVEPINDLGPSWPNGAGYCAIFKQFGMN